jgi:cell filamentation protein
VTSLRYQTPQGPEAEFEPGSRGRVLRNKRAIHSKRDMDRAEIVALEQAQEAYLDRVGADTPFTAALIGQMHRDWLGELYAWAGTYRTVELAKAGFSWPPARLVEQNMLTYERTVLAPKTPCRPGPLGRVSLDMAEVHAELLLVHPFREGNGRLGRWISDLMALQAGFPIPAYHFTGRGSALEKRRYLNAVKRGYLKDYRPLAEFLADAVERGEAPP